MLWPKSVRSAVKTGHDREVVSVYPYRAACPSTVWAELIASAERELIFAGYTNYFLWLEQPAFHATLKAKARTGCRIRFLIGDPDSELTRARERIEDVALTVGTRIRITLENLDKLRQAEGIEMRFCGPDDAPNFISLSVFRFDDDALVTPHLALLSGHDSPMMHLRKRDEGGLFDRFTEHADVLWSRAIEPPAR
ncbi:XRE family transcriptional regulator [Wenjunlia tyrosinilytica]|uniref:XRE family transcriptional regulator n=2 Tax=Wenjunlia tyrosinilytica TaxID=1544741 RepID=A0A917ZN32_9ACTN|nr:XRE family transcriptional regulator [Wenjunlia tyrosinilytica]